MSALNKNLLSNCEKNHPVFDWSPLPPRKHQNFILKSTEETKDATQTFQFYPNCDVNVWLRSCEQEITEPIEGSIKGQIPDWLNGSLLRNGPGSLKAGKDTLGHLFDSFALLHRFNISKGKVAYQCRFIRSEVYKKNVAAKRIIMTGFGTKAVPDPCQTIFHKISSLFYSQDNSLDNSMISVYPFGDEIYAFSEIPKIHKINPENLDTEGAVDISNYVSIIHHTSHPHIMPDGDVYNLGLSLGKMGPCHSIVHFPCKKRCSNSMFDEAKIIAALPVRWSFNPSYMHTFGVTDNFFIVVEQPLTVSVSGMITSRFKNEPLAASFRWYNNEKTRICLLSRKTGGLEFTFYAEAFFYLHIINQYEFNDHVILDICIYRDPAMLECMYIETMQNMQQNPDYAKMFRGRPARFILPINSIHRDMNQNLVELPGTEAEAYYDSDGNILVKPERLCNLGCETPRIHYERYLGKPYRYFYAISSDVDALNPGTIIKVDTVLKRVKTWCEENCYPSEPIFVPREEPQAEDDGVILSAMVWGKDDTNHVGLLVLDAKTFTEIGRAEFRTPSPVPKCLHGWYIPQK